MTALRAEIAGEAAARDERILVDTLALADAYWIGTIRRNDADVYYTDGAGNVARSRSGVTHYRPWLADHVGTVNVAGSADARVVARLAAVKNGALVAAVATFEARRAEWLAAIEHRETLIAEKNEAIRAYVIACVPTYERAAREGRDVTDTGRTLAVEAVKTAVEASIESTRAPDGVVRAITLWCPSWTPRSPRCRSSSARSSSGTRSRSVGSTCRPKTTRPRIT